MKITRRQLRRLIKEALSSESDAADEKGRLATAFDSTHPGNKTTIGNIGERIAVLTLGNAINLNDVKQNSNFPYSDVMTGNINEPLNSNTVFYSVKATRSPKENISKRTGDITSYSARDPFDASKIHEETIGTLLNKGGNLGIRDEIEGQYPNVYTAPIHLPLDIQLGAIGIYNQPLSSAAIKGARQRGDLSQTIGDRYAVGIDIVGPQRFTVSRELLSTGGYWLYIDVMNSTKYNGRGGSWNGRNVVVNKLGGKYKEDAILIKQHENIPARQVAISKIESALMYVDSVEDLDKIATHIKQEYGKLF